MTNDLRAKVILPELPQITAEHIKSPIEYKTAMMHYENECIKLVDAALQQIAESKGIDFNDNRSTFWQLSSYLIQCTRRSGAKGRMPEIVLLDVSEQRQHHSNNKDACKAAGHSLNNYQTTKRNHPLLWEFIQALDADTREWLRIALADIEDWYKQS